MAANDDQTSVLDALRDVQVAQTCLSSAVEILSKQAGIEHGQIRDPHGASVKALPACLESSPPTKENLVSQSSSEDLASPGILSTSSPAQGSGFTSRIILTYCIVHRGFKMPYGSYPTSQD